MELHAGPNTPRGFVGLLQARVAQSFDEHVRHLAAEEPHPGRNRSQFFICPAGSQSAIEPQVETRRSAEKRGDTGSSVERSGRGKLTGNGEK